MSVRTFVFALCWLALGASVASAHNNADACDARIEQPALVTASFADPLTNRTASESFTLNLTGISDPACRFDIGFEEVRGQDGLRREHGRRTMPFKIALDSVGATVIYDSENSRSVFTSRTAAPANGRVTLHLIARAGDTPRAGRYEGAVRVSVRARGQHRELHAREIPLEAFVPAHVRAFLTGVSASQGSYAMLDFEELTRGETGRVTLRVLATGGFELAFESEHGGRLAHNEIASTFVPYQLSAGTEAIDLSGLAIATETAGRRSRPNRSHGQGVDLPIHIRIGDTTRAPAGRYQDRITITVSAR